MAKIVKVVMEIELPEELTEGNDYSVDDMSQWLEWELGNRNDLETKNPFSRFSIRGGNRIKHFEHYIVASKD